MYNFEDVQLRYDISKTVIVVPQVPNMGVHPLLTEMALSFLGMLIYLGNLANMGVTVPLLSLIRGEHGPCSFFFSTQFRFLAVIPMTATVISGAIVSQ